MQNSASKCNFDENSFESTKNIVKSPKKIIKNHPLVFSLSIKNSRCLKILCDNNLQGKKSIYQKN